MKRIDLVNRLALLPLTFASLLISYPAFADEPILPIETESLVSASGNSGSYATSTLIDSLLGHWMTADGATHYYFGRNEVVVVSLLQRQDRSMVSHKQKLSYEVLSVDEVTGCIQLQINTPLGWAETRRLALGSDRRTLLETMEVMGHTFSNEWTYVDGSQQP